MCAEVAKTQFARIAATPQLLVVNAPPYENEAVHDEFYSK